MNNIARTLVRLLSVVVLGAALLLAGGLFGLFVVWLFDDFTIDLKPEHIPQAP